MSGRSMQRNRDSYTNYSFHYESLLHNARQLPTLGENEIQSLRVQIQEQQFSIELESQLLILLSYFHIITELMRLGSLNNESEKDEQLNFDSELIKIREHFQPMNEQLLSMNFVTSFKTRTIS